jgi:hypothetical protein
VDAEVELSVKDSANPFILGLLVQQVVVLAAHECVDFVHDEADARRLA